MACTCSPLSPFRYLEWAEPSIFVRDADHRFTSHTGKKSKDETTELVTPQPRPLNYHSRTRAPRHYGSK